jgi:hypothetical protein
MDWGSCPAVRDVYENDPPRGGHGQNPLPGDCWGSPTDFDSGKRPTNSAGKRPPKPPREVVIYCCVSSHDQKKKGDLARQVTAGKRSHYKRTRAEEG